MCEYFVLQFNGPKTVGTTSYLIGVGSTVLRMRGKKKKRFALPSAQIYG